LIYGLLLIDLPIQGIVGHARISVNINLERQARPMNWADRSRSRTLHAQTWLALALGPFLALAAGCGRDDTDCLARIGQKAVARAEILTEDANNRLGAGWHALREGTTYPCVESRVTARLAWDKELAAAKIKAARIEGGIELRGKVGNLEQRRRATELAQSTIGVEKVIDALELAEPEPSAENAEANR
jgi:hypothetical protein